MNCQDAVSQIPELLYGELDAGAATTLHDHLASCATCRAEHAALDRTMRSLDAWGPVESTADASTLAALAIARARVPGRSLVARAAPWLAGLAAGLLLFAGLVIGRSTAVAPTTSADERQAMLIELARLVRDEVDLDRTFTMTALEGRIDEYQGEQDRKYVALLDALERAWARGERRLSEVHAIALDANQDARHSMNVLDDIIELVAFERTQRLDAETQEIDP